MSTFTMADENVNEISVQELDTSLDNVVDLINESHATYATNESAVTVSHTLAESSTTIPSEDQLEELTSSENEFEETLTSSTSSLEPVELTSETSVAPRHIIHIPSMNNLFSQEGSPSTVPSSTPRRLSSSSNVFEGFSPVSSGTPNPPPTSLLSRSFSSSSSHSLLSRKNSSSSQSRMGSFRCVSPTDNHHDGQRDSPRDALKQKLKNKVFSASFNELDVRQVADVDVDTSDDEVDGSKRPPLPPRMGSGNGRRGGGIA